jgi:hypothetical protein
MQLVPLALTFDASFLNSDGSLAINAFVTNAPLTGCPGCGDPTGFVLSSDIMTGAVATPEPAEASFLVAFAGLVCCAYRRRKQQA